MVAVSLLLFAGCASPPKEVADTWRKYRAAKQGMTSNEIHSLVGGSPHVSVKYYEWWLTREPGELGYFAALHVFYDQDGRATNVSRGLSRLTQPVRGLVY
jgi:hypothetical protein